MIVDDNHPAWISDTFQISICFLEFFLSIILLQEVLSTNEKKKQTLSLAFPLGRHRCLMPRTCRPRCNPCRNHLCRNASACSPLAI